MTSLQQLHSVLQAEQSTASKLLAILKSEREMLTNSDVDAMTKVTAQKQPFVVQLEQLGRQREAILQAEGFSAGKVGLAAFIANQTEQHSRILNSMVDGLKVIAKACREHNQVNGGIANVNRQYLQQAMNILRGRDVAPSAYGPGGEYTNQVVRQPLLGRV
jgi:flagella synthesis protein FlgN